MANYGTTLADPALGTSQVQVDETTGAIVNTVRVNQVWPMAAGLTLITGSMNPTGTYAAGGFQLVFNALAVGTVKLPLAVFFMANNGFIYEYTLSTQKVVIRRQNATTGALQEIPNGVLPAGVIGVAIPFLALVPKLG